MTAWYFLFEGRFREGDPTYGCKGVCSSCLVPQVEREKALDMFMAAVNAEGIELVNIDDEFSVDPSELDKNTEENTPWINWHDETWTAGKVLFDPWQVFDLGT